MSKLIGPLLTRPEFAQGRWDGTCLSAADPMEARLLAVEQALHALQSRTAPAVSGSVAEQRGQLLVEKAVQEGLFRALAEPEEKALRIKDLNVGDVFSFGRWRFRADESEKPLQWQILEKGRARSFVVSKYCLFEMPYHSKKEKVTWETCDLRSWLNHEFYERAFREKERAEILLTDVPAEKNERYETNGGNSTRDWIFLLSASEAKRYFASDVARMGKTLGGTTEDWWLRTPGKKQTEVAYVDDDGWISLGGFHADGAFTTYVRPAMWLRADTEVDRSGIEKKQEVAQ